MAESLIIRSHVRKRILQRAKVLRPGWDCKRVSGQALDKLEYMVMRAIDRNLKSHPTIGVTFTEVI